MNESKNEAQIIFAGNGAEDVEGDKTTRIVTPGQDFKFTIDKKDGYKYTVTAAKKDDSNVAVTDNGDGSYTIAGEDIAVGDVITVTVTKTRTDTGYKVEVYQYVKVGDKQAAFLILAKLNDGVTLPEGTNLAYNGDLMFRNDTRYKNTYAYLVISDKDLDTVKEEASEEGVITEVTKAAKDITVSGDVNGTGMLDINDAQLVYNIYKPKYNSFETTTMAMFLAADMNGDYKITVDDAAVVVDQIKKQQ